MARAIRLAMLLGLVLLAHHAFAQEDAAADVEVEEEDEEVTVDAEGESAGAPPQQQQLSPEQQQMQARLQRMLMGKIMQTAQPECAAELRAFLSMSPQEQQTLAKESNGQVLTAACNEEVNGIAAEFNKAVQAGEISLNMDEEEDVIPPEYMSQGEGPEEEADTRSTLPIVASVLLGVLLLVGGAVAVAQVRHNKWKAWMDEDPKRWDEYNKKNKPTEEQKAKDARKKAKAGAK